MLCGIFNPDKVTDQNENERIQESAHWLTDLQTLEKRMVELQFTGIRKYQPRVCNIWEHKAKLFLQTKIEDVGQ